jgi:hypothetical protein
MIEFELKVIQEETNTRKTPDILPIKPGLGQDKLPCNNYANGDIVACYCPTGFTQEMINCPEARCAYCSQGYTHAYTDNTRVFPPITQADFDRQIKTIIKKSEITNLRTFRIGKSKDSWMPQFPEDSRKSLMALITAVVNSKVPMLSENIQSIIVTKLLPFDEGLAQFFLNTNTIIHYSLGKDDWEIGACNLGYTNEERIKLAKLYYNFGVNTHIRIVADMTKPMPDYVKEYINKIETIPILFTPLRYFKQEFFEAENPGFHWTTAVKNKYDNWTCTGEKPICLEPAFIHPSWPADGNYCTTLYRKDGTKCHGCNGCGIHKNIWIEE